MMPARLSYSTRLRGGTPSVDWDADGVPANPES